jgi:hypothetical protein
MSFLQTRQNPYQPLKRLGVDDTPLVWTDGTNQTVDKAENRHSSITVKDVPQDANAAVIVFHGTHATAPADKTMTWELYGYREGGPAEMIASGTATLGTQRVAKGTATEMYADTIAITSRVWLDTLSVIDNGNNRMAKLCFDMYGLAGLACATTNNSSSTTTGAKVAFV